MIQKWSRTITRSNFIMQKFPIPFHKANKFPIVIGRASLQELLEYKVLYNSAFSRISEQEKFIYFQMRIKLSRKYFLNVENVTILYFINWLSLNTLHTFLAIVKCTWITLFPER